jgi:hypothetical protein
VLNPRKISCTAKQTTKEQQQQGSISSNSSVHAHQWPPIIENLTAKNDVTGVS